MHDPHMDVDYIGTAEAATLLGVSQRTIQRRVQNGDLTPVMRFAGGGSLFRRTDVQALLETSAA